MTIHEFANFHRLQMLGAVFTFDGPSEVLFPTEDTDALTNEDGTLFVAINRVTGRFAAQRGDQFASGFSNYELTREQIATMGG